MGFFISINMTSLKKLYKKFCESSGFTTDTRKIERNNIFFALKGENFNGNAFAQQALKMGCAYVVIDEKQIINDDRYLLVEDVLTTLQQLATYHRKTLKIPILALTGSNGKTTTKELIASVLKKKFKVLATKGNLNNHIGVPLTLLSIKTSHEIAVIEMGANHQKEIHDLCEIAQPDMGLITNIGSAHLEGFGGIKGVIKGKTEMYDYLKQNKRSVFFNIDNPLLESLVPKNINTFSYGVSSKAYCSFNIIKENDYATISYDNTLMKSQLQGDHQYENIAVAVCIGKYFNINTKDISDAINEYIPSDNRSQELKTAKNMIFLDAYNANPTSMKVSLHHFLKGSNINKIVILGDMFELGEYSKSEHTAIIKLLEAHKNIEAYLVGQAFYENKKDNTFKYFKNTQECFNYIKQNQLKDKSILIKGSRSMKLEKLTDIL